jgi:trehalose 6-phosphate phosphatase
VTSALLHEALAPLRSNPDASAVLFDIDGTLAPIVANSTEARVPEPTRQLLIAVARRFGLVACITGRRAADARALVSIGTITYIGSHGAELLKAGWTEAVLDPSLREWIDRIADFRRQVDTAELRRARVRIEDKGPIVAFHWRGATDEEVARAAVDALAAQAEAAGLEVHWGRKVMEARPPIPIDKGAGVVNLLRDAHVGAGMFVGDDFTDLDAFRMLRKLKDGGELTAALCVGVRSEEGPPEIVDEADIVVDGTDGVRELLIALVAEADAPSGAGVAAETDSPPGAAGTADQ